MDDNEATTDTLRARIAALEAEVARLARTAADHGAGSDRRMRAIADALPVMISYVDRDQRFRFANRAFEQWFGRPAGEIVGRSLAELMPPAVYAERVAYIARTLAGERVSYDAPFPRDGVERRSQVLHIPHIADGEVRGFIALVHDVTEEWSALQVATESEARFRRIADSAPVPMWVTAADRTRAFANQAYVAFVGLPYDDALRFDWRRILHVDDHDRILAESAAGEASRQRFVLEARYCRGDGEWRWLRSTSQPRFDAAGMPEGFIGVAEDITEAKRAEEMARIHAETLSAQVDRRTRERDRLWDLSQDAILIGDAAGVLLSASPALTAQLGWTGEQLIGRTTEWIEHPDDRAATRDAWRRLAGGERLRDFTNRLRAADGRYRTMTWSAVPDGDRVYCVVRDVTAEQAAAQTLREVEDALRQAQKMESLGQLTGGVAHDFNNLLTPILGTLDLLARRPGSDERSARLIDGALQSAGRARTLVQRLLAFARRQPLQLRAIALDRLVTDLHDMLRHTVGPAVTLELAIEDGVAPVTGDANQLEMALLNLAVNARDAMPDGGRLRIAVSAEPPDQPRGDLPPGRYVRIAVADSGLGMDQETQRRAVEPFFTTKAPGAGTGLGLSMVHGLAGQLGGTLSISSRPDAGTTVTLLLPAAAGDAEASVAGEEMEALPLSILLVDDDRLVRASTAAMLADLHHRVTDCGSGAEALRLLDQGLAPDLLVTDQVMPQMTGTQLIARIREAHPTLPALIISGYPQGDADQALTVGRLAKPFRRHELARALAGVPLPARAVPA